ncbi:MAG TPA: SHOCT domain-containing protein [bacterium]|jgi:putative membrane protein|nr:SHOCT domain-containing protein [bacterium]
MRTRRILPLLLLAAVVLSEAIPALAQPMRPFGPRALGDHPHGPWIVAAFGLFMLLRALVVIGLVIVVWRLVSARGLWQRPDSATQVLRERYARGEIGEEEYRKRLETLA